MYKLLFFCLCFCLAAPSIGQLNKNTKFILTATSNDGNYLFLLDKNDLNQPIFLSTIDHFVVKRTVISGGVDSASMAKYGQQAKPIGEVKRTITLSDLKKILKPTFMAAYKEAFQLKTDEALVGYFNSHTQPDDYQILYPMIETRLALGHVFLDKEVQKGVLYYYEVYSVNKNKTATLYAKAVAIGKVGNYRLPFFKALNNGMTVRDSSVTMHWIIPITMNLNSLPKPTQRFSFDPEGKLYNTFFSFGMLKARVSVNKNGEWTQLPGLIMPQLNATRDSLMVSFYQDALPSDVVQASILLEDDIHNQGGQSDTLTAYIVTNSNAPKLTSMHVIDTLNGLRISWTPFPNSPYLSGIQIIRYTNVQKGDTLPLVPLTDTQYFDYQIKAGVQYRYEGRVLYQPGMNVFQLTPASSFGTLTKFSRPMPPFRLTANVEGHHIRLNWEVAKDPTIANYFLYRGTSPNNLLLLPGMITANSYLDSAESLSGGSTYYYAVVSQNLMQDTSIYSNLAAIIPNRKLLINPPTAIQFYYTNRVLTIFWEDARSRDNKVVKYLVQRKRVGIDGDFVWFAQQPISKVNCTDADMVAGTAYQYRIASISFKGDTSRFSELATFKLSKKAVEKMDKFFISNEKDGILITLPTVVYENRKGYGLYKRSSLNSQFTKIATLSADQFVFSDKEVVANETYQYALTVIEKDGREGGLGNIMTIKH